MKLVKITDEHYVIVDENAEIKEGIYESGINSCVNGKQKSSKGFIWKRKNSK